MSVFDKRCAALLRKVRRNRAEAILVTMPENVFYLSGFTGEDSWLVVAPRRRVLVTDSRFTEEAERSCTPDVAIHCRRGAITADAADILKSIGRPTAFEASHMPFDTFERLKPKRASGFKLLPSSGLVESLRIIKDDDEVAAIERAVRVAETAMTRALAEASPGESETDFAARLEYAMRIEGAQGAGFPTIAAGEPNSSLPHAKPGSASICASSTLLVDWGASVARYNSDLTRVAAWGKVTPRIARIWRVVEAAQKAALRTLRAGVAASRVDAAARKVIVDAGFGALFGHGLGHGVGLEVHEGPALSPRSTAILKAGMVVTVEPGIYIPGVGGVRLEDMVLVTATGGRVLTSLSREPRALAALACFRADIQRET